MRNENPKINFVGLYLFVGLLRTVEKNNDKTNKCNAKPYNCNYPSRIHSSPR